MLTQKQVKFADALASGMPATRAAIDAGYSAKSAGSIGCRLSKDPKIQAHIARQRQAAPRYKRTDDPLIFLAQVMGDHLADPKLRIDAAKALLMYTHQKPHAGGKKAATLDAAHRAGSGKLTPGQRPSIVKLDDHRTPA